MFEVVRRLTLRQLLREQLLMVVALGIAELLYKFHSFVLEAGAFLLTWFALGVVHSALKSLTARLTESTHEV